MKKYKRAAVALFVALSVMSVLPGCGKKKKSNNEEDLSGVSSGSSGFNYNGSYPGSNVGSGQCIQPGAGQAFWVGGQAQIGATGINYALANVGSGSGFQNNVGVYLRNNSAGDVMYAQIFGNINQTGSVIASVQLSGSTVQALSQMGACVYAVLFQQTGASPGSPGSLYGGMWLLFRSQMYPNGYYMPL